MCVWLRMMWLFCYCAKRKFICSLGEVTDQSIIMSLDLNDAAMAGNAEEVRIRLRMGESPNQKFYPRWVVVISCSENFFTLPTSIHRVKSNCLFVVLKDMMYCTTTIAFQISLLPCIFLSFSHTKDENTIIFHLAFLFLLKHPPTTTQGVQWKDFSCHF